MKKKVLKPSILIPFVSITLSTILAIILFVSIVNKDWNKPRYMAGYLGINFCVLFADIIFYIKTSSSTHKRKEKVNFFLSASMIIAVISLLLLATHHIIFDMWDRARIPKHYNMAITYSLFGLSLSIFLIYTLLFCIYLFRKERPKKWVYYYY